MPAHKIDPQLKKHQRSVRLPKYINDWLRFQYNFHGKDAANLIENALVQAHAIQTPGTSKQTQ